jgi:inner membrane protein
MMGKTHSMVGGAAWLGALAAIPTLRHGLPALIGGWGIAYLAALGPDIDLPRSTITNMLGPVTRGIYRVLEALGVKHRGFTHSIVATVLVALAMSACVMYWHMLPWVMAAVVIGWLSHPLIDTLNKKRVQFLWPFRGGFNFNLMGAGSNGENYVIFPLAILANIILLGMVILG